MKLENRKLTIEADDKPGHYKYHGVDAVSKGETDFEFDLGYAFEAPLEIKYVVVDDKAMAKDDDDVFTSTEMEKVEVDYPLEDDSELIFVRNVTLQKYSTIQNPDSNEADWYNAKIGSPVEVVRLGFQDCGSGMAKVIVETSTETITIARRYGGFINSSDEPYKRSK